MENDDYINFGDFARKELSMQCQYASYYISGIAGYPKLSNGLRIEGNLWDYHSLKIHKDDAMIFKERYEKWIKEMR